jgi:hypothetical protein
MALSQLYTAVAGHTITAARWNNEFGNIYNNGTDLVFPVTKAVGFEGFTITLDAADVTTLISTAATAFLLTPGNKTGTPSTTGSFFDLAAGTFNDNNTAGSGTVAAWTGFAIQRPSLTATNALVTTTDAATLYIPNAPLASTNQTITNPWAIWIDAGNVRFDDNIYWRSGTGFAGILDHANSATRTYTFPDADTTLIGTSDTNTLSNKTLASPVISGTVTGTWTLGGTVTLTISQVAPATPTAKTLYEDSIVKGWVLFDISGVIDDDLNVSSVTDNGAGDWTVNWATAFSTANYVALISFQHGNADSTGACVDPDNNPTTTTLRVNGRNDGGRSDPTGARVRIHVMAIGNN